MPKTSACLLALLIMLAATPALADNLDEGPVPNQGECMRKCTTPYKRCLEFDHLTQALYDQSSSTCTTACFKYASFPTPKPDEQLHSVRCCDQCMATWVSCRGACPSWGSGVPGAVEAWYSCYQSCDQAFISQMNSCP